MNSLKISQIKIPTDQKSSSSSSENFGDFDFHGDFDTEIDVNFDNFNKSSNQSEASKPPDNDEACKVFQVVTICLTFGYTNCFAASLL